MLEYILGLSVQICRAGGGSNERLNTRGYEGLSFQMEIKSLLGFFEHYRRAKRDMHLCYQSLNWNSRENSAKCIMAIKVCKAAPTHCVFNLPTLVILSHWFLSQ